MSRIQPVAKSQRTLLVRLINFFAKRQFGQEADTFDVIGRSPGLVFPYLMGSQLAQAKTELDNETKALAMHLVAARNGCAWCIDFGLAQSVKAGVPLEKMVAVLDYATDSRFSPAERAALAYADAVTENHGHVSDEIFDALRPHFNEREIVELTVSMAIEDFFNRTNGPLGIESQNFCVMPAALQPGGAAGTALRAETGM